MFESIDMPYRVSFDASFKVADAVTVPPDNIPEKADLKKRLKRLNKELAVLQHRLFAENKRALLLIFQAIDAAGKDSTIRAVFRGVNPAGCHVSSFKKPSSEELDHDYLWRTSKRLPNRGQIGVFNRSYYEETLVVRVHPEYLDYQRIPGVSGKMSPGELDELWQQRYESIRDHERHLSRNGTVIIKFWLNVSKEEQRQRFLSRLNEPRKNWKFASGDMKEREFWDDYMQAYEEVIAATSTRHAPWYAIPADNKLYMRVVVAETIVETLKALNPQFPEVADKQREQFAVMRQILESQASDAGKD
jgi:PPK2 family polyphosphate:nucleotide phosphotransferase